MMMISFLDTDKYAYEGFVNPFLIILTPVTCTGAYEGLFGRMPPLNILTREIYASPSWNISIKGHHWKVFLGAYVANF